jgi:hypothetical protein
VVDYNGGGLDREVPDAGGLGPAGGGAAAAVQARAAVARGGARTPNLIGTRTTRIIQVK